MKIECDGIVHNPLGGASYMFEKENNTIHIEAIYKKYN